MESCVRERAPALSAFLGCCAHGGLGREGRPRDVASLMRRRRLVPAIDRHRSHLTQRPRKGRPAGSFHGLRDPTRTAAARVRFRCCPRPDGAAYKSRTRPPCRSSADIQRCASFDRLGMSTARTGIKSDLSLSLSKAARRQSRHSCREAGDLRTPRHFTGVTTHVWPPQRSPARAQGVTPAGTTRPRCPRDPRTGSAGRRGP
jgi:hypothetical protein